MHYCVSMSDVRSRLYPEVGAGGFTHVDGTVEFYQRINALLRTDSVVVDLGAGRGGYDEDPILYHRQLRNLRGRVGRVIGMDIDPVILENRTVDETHVIPASGRLDLPDSSVDFVISDYTFEHVSDPVPFADEISRILRPGGWLCARTPNKWGYIGICARVVPNRLHTKVLRYLQPHRKQEDTFDVVYRMNTRRDLEKYFSPAEFDYVVYRINSEPAYFAHSLLAWTTVRLLFRCLPDRNGAIMMIFLHRHD